MTRVVLHSAVFSSLLGANIQRTSSCTTPATSEARKSAHFMSRAPRVRGNWVIYPQGSCMRKPKVRHLRRGSGSSNVVRRMDVWQPRPSAIVRALPNELMVLLTSASPRVYS